jgi:hypothetical protein
MNNNHLGSTWTDYEREAQEKGVLTPEREALIRAETDNILSALINERKINSRENSKFITGWATALSRR